MRYVVLLGLLTLVACAGAGGAPNNLAFGGAPLISGKSPAAPQAFNSEPEPVNSLPPGAQGLQSSGPNNTQPNFLSGVVHNP